MTILAYALGAAVYLFGAACAWALFHMDCPPSQQGWKNNVAAVLVTLFWPVVLVCVGSWFALFAALHGKA